VKKVARRGVQSARAAGSHAEAILHEADAHPLLIISVRQLFLFLFLFGFHVIFISPFVGNRRRCEELA
jgi:hypothetical protein